MSRRKMILHSFGECRMSELSLFIHCSMLIVLGSQIARADLLASATGYTGDLPDLTRASNDDNELSRTMSRTLGETQGPTTDTQILGGGHPDGLESSLDAARMRSDSTIWKTSEDNDIGEQHQQRSDPPATMEAGSQAESSEVHQQYAPLTVNQTTQSIGQNGQYNQIVEPADSIKQLTNETLKLNATSQPEPPAHIRVATFSSKPLGKLRRRKKKRKQKQSIKQPANKMITYVSSMNVNSAKKQQQRIIYKPNLKQQMVDGHNYTIQMNRWYRLPATPDASSNQTTSNLSDLVTQTSVLLNSAVRGPFHLNNDRELANYNRLWNTKNPSSANDGETTTASSSEANSFVDLAQPESPVITGSSPGISPDHEQLMLDASEDPDSTDSELDLDQDYSQEHTDHEPKAARGNSAKDPKDTLVEGQQLQTNVVEAQVQQGQRANSNQEIKPQTGEAAVLQDHLETASQLNTTTTSDGTLLKSSRQPTVAAATLSRELLVGPFKSESEAPATITLEGVVYQKSGASSALIKSEPARQHKSPGERDGLSASGSSSAVSSSSSSSVSSSSSSAAANNPQQTSLSPLPAQANVGWPTSVLNQATLDGSSIHLAPNNNLFYGSIKSLNADQIAAAVSGQQQHPQALFSDSGTTNNHISAMDFRPTSIQSGIGSLLSMLSPFNSHSAHQFVVANQPAAHSAPTPSDTIEQLKQLHLFKQKHPSHSLEKLTLPSGLSINHQSAGVAVVGESLASSSSGGQDPRGTTTIWVGKNNQSIMDQLSPSATVASSHLNSNHLQQMLASESAKYTHSDKEKAGPIVLVQKDVKPVKYHLLRAYLKLRRLLRPAEATYVFPNDSSGFLRRWLSKRSQSN